MTRRRADRDADRDLAGTALDAQRRRRVAEALGPRPRAALSALVGCGLSDGEIARYHGLPDDLVAELRSHWRLPPNL